MNHDVVISVIIATKERTNSLNVLLKSLETQTFLVDEVIIIDQSTLNNYDKIKSNGTIDIHYIHNPAISGLTQARNVGIDNAKGDFIFFFDDDLELLNDFIENMMEKMMKHQDIVGLCGKQIVKKEKSQLYLFIREFFKKGPYSLNYKKDKKKYLDDNIEIRTKISGGITVYRSNIFKKFRFDENMIKYCLGEDADFSYRISQKHNIGINYDARSYHHHDKSGRLDFVSDFAARYCFYKYFYEKNCNKAEAFYCYWIIFGLWINAVGVLFKTRNVDAIKGIIEGKKYVNNNYEDSPCIRIANK